MPGRGPSTIFNRTALADTYRHKGLRRNLVKTIKQKGIRDGAVLEAIGKIPRHLFLDKAFEEWAYRDVPFPIGNEQTISQPYTVARQTELLMVKPGMRVLEIGTGSGYQACVLYEMGAKVYTVERVEPLFERTNKLLQKLGYKYIRTFLSDGTEGLSKFAPFDRILVTAAASEIPEDLLSQLAEGGVLVIPVGGENVQKMLRITRVSQAEFKTEEFGDYRFVPCLKGIDKG